MTNWGIGSGRNIVEWERLELILLDGFVISPSPLNSEALQGTVMCDPRHFAGPRVQKVQLNGFPQLGELIEKLLGSVSSLALNVIRYSNMIHESVCEENN